MLALHPRIPEAQRSADALAAGAGRRARGGRAATRYVDIAGDRA